MPRAKAPGLVKMSHTVVRFNQMLCIVGHHFNKSGDGFSRIRTSRPEISSVGAPSGARRTVPVRLKPHLPRILGIIHFHHRNLRTASRVKGSPGILW